MMYERYCELRDSRKLKDSDVADALGITKSTFTGWKQGTLRPNTDKLYKIAKYFGTTVEYLVSGIEADYRDEYKAAYDCDPEDFRLMKELKGRDALWGLLKLERDMRDEKLIALRQVIEALDSAVS